MWWKSFSSYCEKHLPNRELKVWGYQRVRLTLPWNEVKGYCFFIFFPFLDFLLVSKLNLNLLILPEVVFIRRTSQYGSFFSEWDFTQLGKWNYRKQKQVNDLQCKITNLFIWKNTWKKSDLAVIGRPFSSIQCIWWDHFLLSQMSLGQKFRLVKHSRDAQVSAFFREDKLYRYFC